MKHPRHWSMTTRLLCLIGGPLVAILFVVMDMTNMLATDVASLEEVRSLSARKSELLADQVKQSHEARELLQDLALATEVTRDVATFFLETARLARAGADLKPESMAALESRIREELVAWDCLSQEEIEAFCDGFEIYRAAVREALAARSNGKGDEAERLARRADRLADGMLATVNSVRNRRHTAAQRADERMLALSEQVAGFGLEVRENVERRTSEAIASSREKAAMGLFVVWPLGLLILVATFLHVRSQTRTITEITKGLEAVAQGSLRDPFGESTDAASRPVHGALVRALNGLRTSWNGIRATQREISDSASSLSIAQAEMANQLQATEEAARALDGDARLSGAVDRVTDACRQLSEVESGFGEVARGSSRVSQSLAEAQQSIARTQSTISELESCSVEIGEVLRTITEIAGQTNLLALNATIEAQRAGEAGRGFAVVATEVKDLSTQTTAATGNIARSVDSMQSISAQTRTVVEEIGSKLEAIAVSQAQSTTLTDEQAQAVHRILGVVEDAGQGIAVATESLSSLGDVAHRAQSSGQQTKATAMELAESTNRLSGQIEAIET